MLPGTLAQLAEQNRPAKIRWTLEKIRAVAEKAGFEVRHHDNAALMGEEIAVVLPSVPPELDHSIVLNLKEDQIWWTIQVIENHIVFKPHLQTRRRFGGTSKIPDGYIETILLKVADIRPVKVEIVGDTVKLPHPIWVQNVTFPLEEARELAEEYIRELAQIVGFDVTLTVKPSTPDDNKWE